MKPIQHDSAWILLAFHRNLSDKTHYPVRTQVAQNIDSIVYGQVNNFIANPIRQALGDDS